MFHDDKDYYYDYDDDDDDDDRKEANIFAEIPDVLLLTYQCSVVLSCYCFKTECGRRAVVYGMDRRCVSGQ